MRFPERPPDYRPAVAELERTNRLLNGLVLQLGAGASGEGRYLHWDEFRRRPPLPGFSSVESWSIAKFLRRNLYRPTPLLDKAGKSFQYALTDPILKALHGIAMQAGGSIRTPEEITNPETKEQYYVSSLMEEAITSSQLEGATTTRQVAKEMIRTGRPPRSRSEQMILNNFRAMRWIGEHRDQDLTTEMALTLHSIVTQGTLVEPSTEGRFRTRADGRIHVVESESGEVFHDPPAPEELPERMMALCDFANTLTSAPFVHPVIRSIIVHFWLAYDHPFVDGNGRTARALFYWSMLRHGLWLFEFVSISPFLLRAPSQYSRAFLYTETDENDLTYFILFQLGVIEKAIQELNKYLERKSKEVRSLEHRLRATAVLNHRQRALLSHALRHPGQRYTFESHRSSHNVVYETARSDLLGLEKRGLLQSQKIGRSFVFTAVKDLEAVLGKV